MGLDIQEENMTKNLYMVVRETKSMYKVDDLSSRV